MNHHKRIVLDFDDTLSFTMNRDWEHAIANTELINKTNKLYDDGWQIDVFTARGSISCKSREDASKKYRKQIEKWLKDNNVKYHSLSFDKPLAAYYIDDKGITPEEFLKIDLKQLEGGLSGSDIYTDGKYVFKEDEHAQNTIKWFNTARDCGLSVPKIQRLIFKTITMEYINHYKRYYFERNFYLAMGFIKDALSKMKNENNHVSSFTFEDYKTRILEHIDLIKEEDDYDFYKETNKLYISLCNNEFKNLTRSFAHGDFGITNMLFTKKEMVLIDPICHRFSCIELDAAKFCASLVLNDLKKYLIDSIRELYVMFPNLPKQEFCLMIGCELLRVYKYHPNKKWFRKEFLDVFRQIYNC